MSPQNLTAWLPETTPAYTWDWPHLVCIRAALDAVTRGECTRLMLFVPPRHGKSMLTTVHYPAWRLEADSRTRVMIGCYTAELAATFSRQIRAIVRTRGRVAFDEERQAATDWLTLAGGGLRAVGVGGGVTGRGADLLIIDDPIKSREEAESAAYRERVWHWYKDDLRTRLEPGGAIVLIMTRWHEDDLAGRLLNSERAGDWAVVCLPALAEANDPLGRPEGAALCPARYDVAALEDLRAELGTRSFASLYQQRPMPAAGALFQRHWFRVIDYAPEGLRWCRYYDLAASTKTTADYTASAAVALGGDGTLYIRDMLRGRWEWPDARKIIMQTMQAEPKGEHAIEEAMHGLAALQELLREPTIAGIALRGVKVDHDKRSRALAWVARAEAGKVALIRGPWIPAFLDEATAFPYGAHDDQVDTVSGGVQMLQLGATIEQWLDYIRQQKEAAQGA